MSRPPFTLSLADLDMFARLGIEPALLTEADVRRVTHFEARDQIGIRYRSDHLEGLAFPYIHPTDHRRLTARIRRDLPEVDGDGRPIAKYVSPPGRHYLYFPPSVGPLLGDAAVTVALVEAEKSALALTAAAQRADRRVLAIATGGCWGWKGTIGQAPSANGARVPEKGPLPDLTWITWDQRDVVLLFDANVATNEKVQAARRALAEELTDRQAHVRIATLPLEDDINGPDDFVGRHGDAALFGLIDDAAGWDVSADDTRPSKVSQSTRLVQLARATGAEWFRDDDQAYVHVPIGRHFETYLLRSAKGRAWLRGLFIDAAQTCPSSQAVADAMHALEAIALRGAEHRVYLRVAAVADAVYVDLGDPTWQLVHIDATGWRLATDVPVRFRRPNALAPLPTPRAGGVVTALRRFVNVTDDDFILFVAWLTAALRGRGPYPILVVNGEEGAAKTTHTRIAKALIDPNRTPLRAEPRDGRDLMIAAEHNHVLAFDNLSGLREWMSDALCRLATGGGFSTRTLYENREEEIFDSVRPVVLNGIPEIATKPDLVSRAVFQRLPYIPEEQRLDEGTFWGEFEAARAMIQGALYTIVSTALARESNVVLVRKPRMADFAVWAVAAESACPWASGSFLRVYQGNRETAIEATLDGEPVADLVRELATQTWTGTSTDLFAELNTRTPESRRSKDWPKNPRQASDALRRLASALRKVGVDVVFRRHGHARRRLITIRDNTPATASASSAGPGRADLPGDCCPACGRSADAATEREGTSSADPSADRARVDGVADAADAADAPAPSLSPTQPEETWTLR